MMCTVIYTLKYYVIFYVQSFIHTYAFYIIQQPIDDEIDDIRRS